MWALLTQGWRSWRHAKSLGLLAIIALGAGIGCTTAIFTIVDAVMLKPLPYAQADRWIALFGGDINEPDRISGLSIADLQEYQRRSHSFDFIGWYRIGGDFNLTAPGQPQHIEGVEITPSLIDNAGVNAIVGRPFNDSDGANVAVISTRLWSRLGGRKAILGKAIELNGEAYTVTGVMPASFQLPFVTVSSTDSHNDVWIPVKPPRNDEQRRGYASYASYARLKSGVTIAQARADVKRVAVEIARDDPQRHRAYTAVLLGLRDFVAKSIRPVLLLLFGAAALLFLITCANVAGLLVAQAVGRARETAVRVALGAGQKQLALEFFVESLFISIPAVILGIVLSASFARLVVALAAEYIPRSEGIATNWAVVLFAIASACVAAILSSMAPLWQAIRTQPNEILSDGVRASAGARSRKLSQGLVVAEIALAFTLLSAGALLVSQLDNLNRISPGFDPDHLVTFQLNSSDARHLNGSGLAAYQKRADIVNMEEMDDEQRGWRATLLSPMVAIRNESDSAWKSARRGVQQTFTLISGAEKTPAFDSELLTEFADASRRAESFSEALRIALATLRDKIQASSAMLLENGSDSEYRCTAAIPESLSTTCNFAPDGFLLNRLRFYDFPLAFSAGDLNTSLRWASEQRPQRVSEIEALKQSGVRLAVALRTKREIAGLLLFGAPAGSDQYSDVDKQLVHACAAQFALMMENARLTDRIVEQEKIRRDVALAVEVQKRLLPEKPPDMTTSSLAAFTLAARSVGGDYYDFLDVGDRRIGIALADIAGKGVAAALIMAVVQASLRIIAAEGNISLPELAAKMNHFLHRSTGTSSYATFFYAQMDEDTRQLRYVNAGHNPPYLTFAGYRLRRN